MDQNVQYNTFRQREKAQNGMRQVREISNFIPKVSIAPLPVRGGQGQRTESREKTCLSI